MMEIFEKAYEKLAELIDKRLDEENASVEDRKKAAKELSTIKRNGDAEAFLFFTN